MASITLASSSVTVRERSPNISSSSSHVFHSQFFNQNLKIPSINFIKSPLNFGFSNWILSNEGFPDFRISDLGVMLSLCCVLGWSLASENKRSRMYMQWIVIIPHLSYICWTKYTEICNISQKSYCRSISRVVFRKCKSKGWSFLKSFSGVNVVCGCTISWNQGVDGAVIASFFDMPVWSAHNSYEPPTCHMRRYTVPDMILQENKCRAKQSRATGVGGMVWISRRTFRED